MVTKTDQDPEWYPEETKKRRHNEKLKQSEERIKKRDQKEQEHQEIHRRALEKEKKTLDILKDPKLLDKCIDEIQKKVVGERETILTILICSFGRKVINHNMTSYNLLINDESGLGKDFVTSCVCELLPEKEFEYRTKITPETFTYWHNPIYDPEWSWDGKVFYLEDAPSKVINSEVFKVMASKGSKATVLINQMPRDIEIRGKPVIFVTSARANPNEENLRRFPIVNLDESEEQTIKIMQRKGLKAKTGENIDYDIDLKEALSTLTRVKVLIPFADKLSVFFPTNRYMRTHFERILDYIKASASFHQKQREKDENGYLIATGEDYDIARIMLFKTTSNPAMIPLTKDQQKILDFLKKHPYERLSVKDIESNFAFSDKWLRKQLDALFSNGFLEKDKDERENVKQKVIVYIYNEEKNSIEIPTWKEICSNDTKYTIDTKDKKDTKVKKPCEKVARTFESIVSIEQETNEKKKSVQKIQKIQKKPSLQEKIKELKKYCNKLKKNGNKITYEALCFNFDKSFIEKCKENKILIVLPNGSYDFGGDNQ